MLNDVLTTHVSFSAKLTCMAQLTKNEQSIQHIQQQQRT